MTGANALAEVATWLESVLPDGTCAELVDLTEHVAGVDSGSQAGEDSRPGDDDQLTDLWPIERRAVASAVPVRRREFAAGRRCAHRALLRLGCTETAIGVGAKREPLWPPGFVGSIAHTRALAVATVVESRPCRSIGIDLELDGSVEPHLHGQLLTEVERAAVAATPSSSTDPDLATLLFSAKEAIYKATYPLTGQWLGFLDAEIEVDHGAGRLRATIAHSVDHPMAGRVLVGHHTRALGHHIVALAIDEP